jgi:hypothetical protein
MQFGINACYMGMELQPFIPNSIKVLPISNLFDRVDIVFIPVKGSDLVF